MIWKNCATCADRITCAEQMGLVQTTCDDAAGTKGNFHLLHSALNDIVKVNKLKLNLRYVRLQW